MKHTDPHISPEAEILFDEFIAETDSLESLNTETQSSHMNPSSLLEVLHEAKALIGTLKSEKQINRQSNEINSRLTHLEKELVELKQIIANHE